MPPSSPSTVAGPSSPNRVAGPSGLNAMCLIHVDIVLFVDTINALCGETMYLMNIAIVLVLICMY